MTTTNCTGCAQPVEPLAVFPDGKGGTCCLPCYTQTPAATAPITADDLTRMWGGRPARRRRR